MQKVRPALLIFLAALAAVLWTRVPVLHQYDLQIVAAGFLIYMVTCARRVRRAHDLLPSPNPLDFPLLTLSLFLLVQATGGIFSPTAPLLLVLGFFGVRILSLADLFVYASAVPFFLFTLPETVADSSHIIAVLILTLGIFLTLLVKIQQDSLKRSKQLNISEELSRSQALLFLHTTLLPKLNHLSQLAEYPSENQEGILRQLEIVKEETTTVLTELQEL